MDIINQVSQTMQEIFNHKSDLIAEETQFIKRRRKLTGSLFAKILVFSWLENPTSSLEDFSQTAQSLSLSISPQSLDERFSQESANFFQALLKEAISSNIQAEPALPSILVRFNGVSIQDATTLSLPRELAPEFPGGANQHSNEIAGVKMSLRWNFNNGSLQALELMPAKNHDQKAFEGEKLEKGSLRLSDLGYFSVEDFKELGEEGVYWLSRLHAGRSVLTEEGEEFDLVKFLKKEKKQQLEMKVKIGKEEQLKARLIAAEVPKSVLRQRRERLKEEAKKKQRPINPISWELARWTILVTNIPKELLSLEEALIIIRVRWQIELLFKLWKSYGGLENWRSEKKWHVLTEMYGKLLMLVVRHWLLLSGCWENLNRSLKKGIQFIRRYSLLLLKSLKNTEQLMQVLLELAQGLKRRLSGKRRKKPLLHQLLNSISP